jgi:phage baseplate assembly protein W
MPKEIAIPFRLDARKGIAVEENINGQIRQHVNSLIHTAPGERVMLPTYGVPLADALFEGDDEWVAENLRAAIEAGFRTWEPGVSLREVAVSGSQVSGDGRADVNVGYYRVDAPTSTGTGRKTNFASVSEGGTVTERTRG